MKKLLSILLLAVSLVAFNSVFTACDKEDNGEYYAGESEEDFKPNYYTITSEWDLSAVSGYTDAQKKAIADALADEINATERFETRAAAVAAFDAVIAELRTDTDVPAGLKATVTLKRGTAIIKRANLKW